MYRVDIDESFPITVVLWDENTGENASGQTVYYDIRDMSDNPLVPAINGIMTESTVASGIYKIAATISTAGSYVCYATCSGFYDSSEEIIVNPESIYDVTKQTQNYNISVEDVPRSTAGGSETASQLARNVPYDKTDYLITWIKADDAVDWSNPVTSGVVYAWYRSTSEDLPYKMGSDQ